MKLNRVMNRRLAWSLAHVRDARPFEIEADPRTLGDVDIFRCLEDPPGMLFTDPSTRDDEGIRIAGSEEARKILNLNFFGRTFRYNHDQLFFGAFSLEDFLGRYLFGRMLSYGRAYVRFDWADEGEPKLITRFELLDEGETRRVRIGAHRNWFRYVRRRHYYFPPRGPQVEYFPTNDVAVFVLEPPFAGRPGRTRLKQAQKLARKAQDLMDAQLAGFHAATYTEDKRWWVERARSIDLTGLLEEMRLLSVRIRGILGGLPAMMNEPTTKYFDAFSVVEYYERLATARESVLREFNRQIVARLLERNGLEGDSGRVEAVARTSREWARVRERFASGQIEYDLLNTILNPAKTKEAAAEGASG